MRQYFNIVMGGGGGEGVGKLNNDFSTQVDLSLDTIL